MSRTLELQIAECRRLIGEIMENLKRHRQRVQTLESQVNRLGLEGEKGEQIRKAFERELEVERDIVQKLDEWLGRETDRLWRLEEQLKTTRPPRPATRHNV